MKKSRLARVLRVLIVVVLLLGVLVAAAPWLAGTGPVRGWIEGKISEAVGRDVELGGLDAGWTSGLKLRLLKIANKDVEFSDENLLEIEDLRIEDGLTDLIFSGQPTRVVVRGLKLNLEEQAGGRTNIDDILTRLAEPKPEAPKVPKKKVAPIHVALKDCSFRFKRLARQPPDRPVDPFAGDPEVRPAGAGAYVVAMKDFGLDVDTGPEPRVAFDGGIEINGKAGHLKGEVDLGDDVRGEVEARGLDLALLSPFLDGDVAGRLDLTVRGGPDGGTVKARVNGLRTAGGPLPALDEEWIDVEVDATRTDAAVQVKKLVLRTASREIDATASGDIPTGEGEAEAPFEVRASFPLRLAFGPTDDVPADGRVVLAAKGAHAGARTDVTGTLTVKALAFRDPQLGAARDIAAAFDLGLDRGARRLAVRKLAAQSEHMAVDLKGFTSLGEPLVCDLAGAARGDLDRLHRLVQPFLDLEKEASVRGQAQVEKLVLKRAASGDLTVVAEATVTDFAATGLFEEDLRSDRSVLSVDASVQQDGDVLVVRAGRLNDLTVAGEVAGLKAGAIQRADGTVKGTLRLNPMLARLAGVDDLDALAGRLTLDVTASTGRMGIQGGGTATLEKFRAKGPFGDVSHDRATVTATVRRDDVGLKVKASLEADNVAASGDFGRVRQPRIEAQAELDRDGVAWHGQASLRGELFRAVTKGTPVWSEDWSTPVTVQVLADDLARLRRQLDGLPIPAELDVAGAVSVRVTAQRDDAARWSAEGAVDSMGVTAQWDGAGPRNEPLVLKFDVKQRERGLDVAVPELVLQGSGTRVSVARGFVGNDGSFRGDIDTQADLGKLARILPQAAEYQPSGKGRFKGAVSVGEGFEVSGRLEANRLRMRIDGRNVPADRIVADIAASKSGDDIQLNTCKVDVDGTTLDATGRLGDRAMLKLVAKGDADALAQFLPQGGGKGPLSLDVDVDAPLREDGAVTARGTFRAKDLSLFDTRLAGASGEFDVRGRRAGKHYVDLTATALVQAGVLSYGAVRLEDVELNQTGTGEIREGGGGPGFAFQAQVRATRALVDAIPVESATVNLRGNLKSLAQDTLDLAGSLRFARAVTSEIVWTEGNGKLRLQDQVAHISDFTALVNGGTVKANGTVDLKTTPLEWKGKVEAENVRLNEQLGRPLSFLVPILRVTGGRERRRLSGTLSTNLDFSGTGTSMATLQHSLSGDGFVKFEDVQVVGSLLLPLLSLRIDQLLGGKPYTFGNLDVGFRVSGGRVKPTPFTIKGELFQIGVSGDAGLDGSLNFRMRPSLLPLPLKVTGNIDRPKVRPTTPKLFD